MRSVPAARTHPRDSSRQRGELRSATQRMFAPGSPCSATRLQRISIGIASRSVRNAGLRARSPATRSARPISAPSCGW